MPDLQLAASENVARRLFYKLRDNFSVSHSDSGSFGPFSVSYSAGVKLKKGTLDFQSDGSVLIKDLDIVYDPLKLDFGIDIPPVTVGGFCILWIPIKGCILHAPKKTFFAGNPDIEVPLDLSGIITSEISTSCGFVVKHFNDPAGAGMTRWAALAAKHSNEWRLHLHPIWVRIDLIDIADTVGNLIDKFIDAAVDDMLGILPDWARDLVKAFLGAFSDLIRTILHIPDDIMDWLSNLLGVSLGLFNLAAQLVADYFANKYPIFAFNDPYPVLPATTGPGGSALVPVLVPVRSPSVAVSTDEMVISASLGVL